QSALPWRGPTERPHASSLAFDTTRTVAAPRPNRVGQVTPQAVQTDTVARPPSGSVVPSWSQRSIRCSSVPDSMWIDTSPSFRGAGRTTEQAYCGTSVVERQAHHHAFARAIGNLADLDKSGPLEESKRSAVSGAVRT